MYVHFKKFTVGRELPCGRRASRWENSFPVRRELPGDRELPRVKRASQWEESFPVVREFPSGKGAS